MNNDPHFAQRKVPFPAGIPSSQHNSRYKEPLLLFGDNEEVNKALEKKLLHNIKKYKIPDTTNTSTELSSSTSSTPASSTTLAHLQSTPTTTTSSTSASSTSLSHSLPSFDDSSLVSKMTTRLSSLEKLAAQQNRMLNEKDILIDDLRSKNDVYVQEMKQLQTERENLKKQIYEMETFLNDYGLVWVGEDELSRSDTQSGDDYEDLLDDEVASPQLSQASPQQRSPSSSPSRTALSPQNARATNAIVYDSASYGRPDLSNADDTFLVDMNKIRASIAELNIIAGEGTTSVVSTGSKMKGLQTQTSIPITFFKNGFMLFAGPFRPFSVKSSLPFLEDILDGYFPYELKERFPDGVPFALTDRSHEEYKQIDRTTKPTATQRKGPNVHSLSSNNNNASASNESVNVETFLRRLPASTIKNGRVIDIRESIAKRIQGGSDTVTNPNDNSNVVIVPTDVVQYLRGDKQSVTTVPSSTDLAAAHTDRDKHKYEDDVFAEQRKGRPQTPRNITTLKIKMEDESVLIIKLKFDDTIAVLRKYIDQFAKSSNYMIRTTFPNVVHSDNKVTLRAAGLVPNATVFIHQIKT